MMQFKFNRALLLSVTVSSALLMGCKTSQPNSMVNNTSPLRNDPPDAHPDAPLNANTHFAAGQVAESQGDYQRAITQYEAACKLDHTATVPLLRLGMIYTKQAQFDLAVATWNRYIKATNGDAAGYCDLGYTLELAQRFAESETAYKTAIAHQPRNETARVNYGLMLARQNRLDDATAQLQVVLSPAEVHYNLASVLESQGKKEAAKIEYRQAIQLDPDMNDAKARIAALE